MKTLGTYCRAIKNLNEHILDKQTERDGLIERAVIDHDLSVPEFNAVYADFEMHLKETIDSRPLSDLI